VAGDGDAGVPKIAERAGVNPTSIYRRWGTRENLLMDAAATRLRATAPMPDTGSLRGDLTAWATGVERALVDPDQRVLLRALVATMGTPPVHLQERAADLQDVLDAAAGRGERAPSVGDLLDHVLAPLYLRVLFGLPLEPGTGEALVDRLLTSGGPGTP